MRIIDTRTDPNIATLREMLEEVSKATRPQEAVEAFGARIGELRRTDALVSVSVRNLEPGHYKITRYFRQGFESSKDLEIGSDDPWKEWESLRLWTGGFVGEVIASGKPSLIHDLHLRDDPVLGSRLADMGSCMAIPLFDGGHALNWTIHFHREPEGYTLKDLADYMLNNNLFGAMTRNLVSLEQVKTLNRRLRDQFEQIAPVQQSLLPAAVPAIPGVRIATSYLTSEQAGGDYYDFFDLGSGRWGILVADVSGHGAGAATVMAMLHGILHAYQDLACGPAAALSFANNRLCAANAESSFTTAVFAVLDSRTRELTVARAGHPHPLLKSRSGVEVVDGPSSLPLGIDPGIKIEQHTLRLAPAQTLLLYTDGVTEVFDSARKMFGVEGVRSAVASSSGRADDVVDSIHGALFRHTGLRTRDDDQTLVVMEVGGTQL